MDKLFNRVVELKIGDTKITGLDIAFDVEKDSNCEPNSCHMEIYNLSQKNREILSRYEQVPVILKAGYKNNSGIIFHGDLVSCQHIKEKTSWKTTLASGDGVAALQNIRINKSFAKNTPIKVVIAQLLKQLGLPKGQALQEIASLDNKLKRGCSLSGSAISLLEQLLASYDYKISIQNSQVQIIKKAKSLKKKAISLSADSGLISTPEIGSNKIIQLKTIIMPELIPGTQLHVKSSVFNGFATIKSVRFNGGNFGSEWGAEIISYKN